MGATHQFVTVLASRLGCTIIDLLRPWLIDLSRRYATASDADLASAAQAALAELTPQEGAATESDDGDIFTATDHPTEPS